MAVPSQKVQTDKVPCIKKAHQPWHCSHAGSQSVLACGLMWHWVLFNDKHPAIIYSGVCMWNSKGRRSLIKNKHSVPKLELALVSLHWENWFIVFLPFDIFPFQFPVCRINFTTLTPGIQITAVPGKWEIGGRTLEQAELTCIYSWINPSEHTWGKICSHPKWDFQEARNKHQWE